VVVERATPRVAQGVGSRGVVARGVDGPGRARHASIILHALVRAAELDYSSSTLGIVAGLVVTCQVREPLPALDARLVDDVVVERATPRVAQGVGSRGVVARGVDGPGRARHASIILHALVRAAEFAYTCVVLEALVLRTRDWPAGADTDATPGISGLVSRGVGGAVGAGSALFRPYLAVCVDGACAISSG